VCYGLLPSCRNLLQRQTAAGLALQQSRSIKGTINKINKWIINQLIIFLRITYEIKPEIFDEKRGNAALLIKNSGFYLIFNP